MLSENSACILKWIAVGKCILLISKPVWEKISGTKLIRKSYIGSEHTFFSTLMKEDFQRSVL